MNVLALDLGMKLGWALSQSGNITGGTVSLASRPPARRSFRWLKYQTWLQETWAGAGGLDAVYFEDVFRHSSRDSSNVYGGLWAYLEAFCGAKDIPMYPVAVPTIKKFWTGAGNAKKERMIESAKERGFHPVDDNHADALALLAYALKEK